MGRCYDIDGQGLFFLEEHNYGVSKTTSEIQNGERRVVKTSNSKNQGMCAYALYRRSQVIHARHASRVTLHRQAAVGSSPVVLWEISRKKARCNRPNGDVSCLKTAVGPHGQVCKSRSPPWSTLQTTTAERCRPYGR